MRQTFEANVRRAGLHDWITVHEGTAVSVASGWTTPIDMLYIDGDCSPRGTFETYDAWVPHLRPGGVIVVNSVQTGEEQHDGPRRLVEKFIKPPVFSSIRRVDGILFAIKSPS
jgi:predicted O-methyltransferase YrrM